METKEAILYTISELNSDRVNKMDGNKGVIVDIQESNENSKLVGMDSEEIDLLLRLRERSLVLFEGLRNTDVNDVHTRLNMVINYLEYQICVIEDRINVLNNTGVRD